MGDDDRPFIVFKFLSDDGTEPDETEDVFYDIGLAKWIITDIDDKMIAKIKWPLFNPSGFVKKESNLNLDWSEKFIKVKRFYATYIDAASACKKYIDDSNYETDKQLGRGMRKKRKRVYLDSESDKESEQEDNLNSNGKKKKIIKKYLNNSNKKKTSDSSRTSIKSLTTPPPVPSFSERFIVSPNKITRQYYKSQSSKQPTFSISISKDFGKNRANFVQKVTSQNEQEDEEKKRQVLKKLKQLKQNKQRFIDTKKHNSEKEFSSPIKKTISEKEEKDDVTELPNLVHTPSKNLSIANKKSNLTDTVMVSLSDQSLTSTKLRTSSPVPSYYTSQSSCRNLFESREYRESSSHLSSVPEINKNKSFSTKDQFINNNRTETNLQVTEFPSLENRICKGFSEIKKEISVLSSKMDMCLMNQEKLNRLLLPGEKVIKKPSNFPSLPVDTKVQLKCLENFLKDDANLSAASIYFAKYIDPGSLDSSVRKILSKIMTNTLAKNFSFQGRGEKNSFETLKVWDLIQGLALYCKLFKVNL